MNPLSKDSVNIAMDTKRSKYDTNPLDPDFVKNTERVSGEGGDGPVTQPVQEAATREFGSQPEATRADAYSEAPTRRYNKASLEASYPSVFVPPTYSPPAQYPGAQPFVSAQRPISRSVAGIGMPERWATALPYLPYMGIVVSLLELFLVPRSEGRVRFYAAQALALHLAIMVLGTVFSIVGAITNTSVGGVLFKTAAFVFLLVSLIRIAKGREHHITALTDLTKWFNDHIELKKS